MHIFTKCLLVYIIGDLLLWFFFHSFRLLTPIEGGLVSSIVPFLAVMAILGPSNMFGSFRCNLPDIRVIPLAFMALAFSYLFFYVFAGTIFPVFDIRTKIDTFLMLSYIVFIGPIIEEFLFRGLLTIMMFKWTGHKIWSVIIVNLIFAACHMNLLKFIPMFVLGCILSYTAIKTKNLNNSIMLHMINNCVAVFKSF